MLYFRFDFNKDDFKGSEHKSVLYGYSVEDVVDYLFEEESEQLNGYYLDEYRKLKTQYWDNEEISEKEYDEKINDLKKEFIADELTLNGCSCFELNEQGIDFAKRYGYDNRPIITIFEGKEIGSGHDGETIAKCEKVIWQGKSDIITDIFYNDDIKNKVEEIMKIIK